MDAGRAIVLDLPFVLRRSQTKAPATISAPLKLLINQDRPLGQIHTLPLQTANLTQSHTGEDRGQVQCPKSMAFQGINETGKGKKH